MIKIFEATVYSTLEKEVNDWIDNCGSKVYDIQFRTVLNENELIYHCCVILELNLHNH